MEKISKTSWLLIVAIVITSISILIKLVGLFK